MITAHFKGNKLIIDISQMDPKYKENGKKIKFSLFYGGEATMASGLEDYFLEAEKEIIYEGQDEVVLEISEIKDGYRGKSIFIGYYIEVNFGKKFLVFKDAKEIKIEGREEVVFNVHELLKYPKYINKKDEYSFKKILEVMPIYKKVILILAIIGLLIGIYGFIVGKDFAIFVTILSVIIGLILIFTAGKSYFKGKILSDKIPESTKLSEIVKGKFRANLEKLKIQIFATNSEKGQYEVDDGSTTRIVSFNSTVGAVLLCEKKFEKIKSGTKIEDLLENENINYNNIYKNLFPEIKITNNNGLALNLEVRIISKNLKDITYKKEIFLDKEKFSRKKEIQEKVEKGIEEKMENSNNSFNSDFFE